MSSDDWRLQVDFRDDGPLDAFEDRLDARELEHDLSEAFHDRVVVSRNETTIFPYAGDKEQAEKARNLVIRLTDEAPAGSKVGVAGTLHEAEDDVPRPFALLGGLAG